MLVISHNPPTEGVVVAENVFKLMVKYQDTCCFAINIKADGLGDMLVKQLQKYCLDNYFTFDMSVPQMIEYRERNIKYFTRQSEYEEQLVLYDDADGVWIDAFENDSWITEKLICAHQKKGKKVCIVSPELHKRLHMEFWNRFILFQIDWKEIMLCTDFPDEASRFFGRVNRESIYD